MLVSFFVRHFIQCFLLEIRVLSAISFWYWQRSLVGLLFQPLRLTAAHKQAWRPQLELSQSSYPTISAVKEVSKKNLELISDLPSCISFSFSTAILLFFDSYFRTHQKLSMATSEELALSSYACRFYRLFATVSTIQNQKCLDDYLSVISLLSLIVLDRCILPYIFLNNLYAYYKNKLDKRQLQLRETAVSEEYQRLQKSSA